MSKYDIADRVMDFAVRCAIICRKLPREQITYEYSKQLIRASASIGANIEEADGTLSKKDFINKMALARREARESRYWLKLIGMTGSYKADEIKIEIGSLHAEANEILLILSSIVNKMRNSG